MNAFWIKVIAITAMLVDHFALFYFPHSLPLQIIGRVSFPLIAWLIANGAVHTKNIDAYLLRLGGFALLAQLPLEVVFLLSGRQHFYLNVLFTLFFGLLAIRVLQLRTASLIKYTAVIAIIVAAGLLHTDYASGGVLCIVAFYLFFDMPYALVASQIFILAILTKMGFFIQPGFGSAFEMHPLEQFGLLALPVILIYNKKRGSSTGYLFYWFFVAQELAYIALKFWSSAIQ